MLQTQRCSHSLAAGSSFGTKDAPQAVESFRFVRCAQSDCGAVFYLCRRHDRGQRYCSAPCRQQARQASVRAARRRHQRSPEGRLDHADRQRVYRERVMDQGPQKLAHAVHRVAVDAGSATEAPRALDREDTDARTEGGDAAIPEPNRPRCVVCGAHSPWVRHTYLSRQGRRARPTRGPSAQGPP